MLNYLNAFLKVKATMATVKVLKFLFLIALQLTGTSPYAKEELRVSAIDWCPQICPNNKENPGYLVEMMIDLFKKSNYQLNFDYTPWSRAIHNVSKGITDGLLSPSKDEAPGLVYHKDPLAYQTHCFFKLKSENWKFKGVNSMKNMKLVIYRDHSYSELLDEYFKNFGKDNYFELSYDSRYIDRSISLLKKKRGTSFLFTVNSVVFHQSKQKLKILKRGACIKKDELWFALTPKNKEKIKRIRDHIDKNLSKYKKSKKYFKLLKKYQISYPKLVDI